MLTSMFGSMFDTLVDVRQFDDLDAPIAMLEVDLQCREEFLEELATELEVKDTACLPASEINSALTQLAELSPNLHSTPHHAKLKVHTTQPNAVDQTCSLPPVSLWNHAFPMCTSSSSCPCSQRKRPVLQWDDETELDSNFCSTASLAASPPTASPATASPGKASATASSATASSARVSTKRLKQCAEVAQPILEGEGVAPTVATPAGADESAHAMDANSRLALTQRNARQHGRSTSLSWVYDENDEMAGARCDQVWFERSELLALSTL